MESIPCPLSNQNVNDVVKADHFVLLILSWKIGKSEANSRFSLSRVNRFSRHPDAGKHRRTGGISTNIMGMSEFWNETTLA